MRQHSSSPVKTWPSLTLRACAAFGAFVGVACGHPASKDDCEVIFARSAEVEILAKNVTDPNEIARAVADARVSKGQAAIQDCVGKRITDDALRCVREAKAGIDLDRCLQ